MPELPEVETVCAGLRQAVVGQVIQKVILNRPDLRVPFPDNFQKQVAGCTITAVTRRAKYIVLHLDDGQIISIHLGMSGRMTIGAADALYEPATHDHMIIRFKNGSYIVLNDARRFGMVFLLREEDMAQHPAFKHLGPEPLGNEFSAPVLREKLKNKAQAIKVAIMDQRVVVGVGNIYACEALFRAGIHPQAKASTVRGEKSERLTREIKTVLQEAIAAGGSTLKDYVQTNGELGYFQHNFAVYDREGCPCATCGCDVAKTGGVKRIVQAGRSTFYCPQSQKRGKG
jgi:formamidopyrimidine-DNA glycosylase